MQPRSSSCSAAAGKPDQAALRRAAARGAQLPDKGSAHRATGDGFPDMDNVLPDKIEPTENPFYRYDHQCQPPDGYSGAAARGFQPPAGGLPPPGASFDPRTLSRISLGRDVVDCIVFWTKNPAPMLPRLGELSDYNWLSVYAQSLRCRPGKAPAAARKRIEDFKRLSDKVGRDRGGVAL